MKILASLCLLCLVLACSENESSKLDFLVGTWKMEGKDKYEAWEQNENNELIGHSYMLNNDQKTISESLLINTIDDRIILHATVPDQNEGKTIQFILNTAFDDYFSFENSKHDFPKKIQYKKITNDKIN